MNIISQVRLLVKLRAIGEKEQKLMRMKLSTSTITQITLGVCDVLNLLMPNLSKNNQVLAGSALGILHIVVNTMAHMSNPDGTSVKVAYEPKEK